MKMRRGSFGRTVVALVLLPLGNALADSPDKPAANRDELSPWALGVGLGLVRSSDQGDLYFAASLRRRIHFRMPAADPSADAPGPAGGADTEQGRPGRVYVEPEVGYWKRSENGLDEKDLLVGVNLVGVVPTSPASNRRSGAGCASGSSPPFGALVPPLPPAGKIAPGSGTPPVISGGVLWARSVVSQAFTTS